MTQQEADKIVLGMGCHSYSRVAMIDALLEGEKIGKREQKAIDEKRIAELEAKFDALVGLNEELCNTIDEYKKKRAADINKACKWLTKELKKLAMDKIDDNFLDNEFKVVLKSDIPKWIKNFRKVLE